MGRKGCKKWRVWIGLELVMVRFSQRMVGREAFASIADMRRARPRTVLLTAESEFETVLKSFRSTEELGSGFEIRGRKELPKSVLHTCKTTSAVV